MRRNDEKYLLITALLLTACSNQRGAEYQAEMAAPSAPAQMKYAAEQDMAPEPGTASTEGHQAQNYLAYRYNYIFALPVKTVAETANSHAQICKNAGPSKCQILSSNTSNASEDYANASLQLRAEPEWLKSFMTQVQSSVESAKGDMTHSGVTAEDLTRSILDTDARLKAQVTLRTRLEGLLATKNAELSDLLALERELARVQGEIESATTTLNVLKKRVSMSVVDLNYQTKQVAVSRSAFSPIGHALKNFAGNISEGIAGVIGFISLTLPWFLLLILPLLWLLRRLWRRKDKKTS